MVVVVGKAPDTVRTRLFSAGCTLTLVIDVDFIVASATAAAGVGILRGRGRVRACGRVGACGWVGLWVGGLVRRGV